MTDWERLRVKPGKVDGSALWAELHRFVVPYLRGEAVWSAEAARKFLAAWKPRVPCGECRNGFEAICREDPPDFSSAEAFARWGWRVHNAVNRKLGYRQWSIEEAARVWDWGEIGIADFGIRISDWGVLPAGHVKKPARWRVNRRQPQAIEQQARWSAAELWNGGPPERIDDLRGYFDRVVVISLRRTPERLAAFWERFAGVDWPFVRPMVVEAVDGRNETPPSWFRQGRGAWGCLQSHRKVLAAAIRDGVQRLLVLEDDAQFPADFGPRVGEFLERVPGDWSCLMIGGQQMGDGFVVRVRESDPSTHRSGQGAVYRVSQCERTHCYAVSAAGMRTLNGWWSREVDGHCDWTLGDLQGRPAFATYRPEKPLAAQGENVSTITSRRERLRAWGEWEEKMPQT